MSLKVCIPKGRSSYYIRGTVRAGQKSRSVYESTGVGAGTLGSSARAEEIRLRREGEIYHELLYGARAVTTFTEAAAGYCEDRQRRRLARNPALKGLPDKEAEYVAKWVTFLRRNRVADIPLVEFIRDAKRHLSAYFDELHVAKGNKLPTMWREADVYSAIMNFAAGQGWISVDFPRPDLPEFDIKDQPVDAWLYDREIQLFVRLAPKHLRLFVAGVFSTGIRGGELLFVSRRPPNMKDLNSSGISLEEGHEFIYLGTSKSGKPIVRALPDGYAAMVRANLAGRTDSYDALFLTDEGKPYTRPRRQRGFIVRTAWKSLRERVATVIERLARLRAHQGDMAAEARLSARATRVRKVTPHWGRHNMASQFMMRGMSDSAAQKAGGWLSPDMLPRYQHTAPEHAKKLANVLDFGVTHSAKTVQLKKTA